MKNLKSNTSGLSLIELLIALMVMSIVLTAAVTLAYAMSSAYESTKNMSDKQAQIRYSALRLSELIKNCRLICAKFSSYIVIWRADDNEDNRINVSEIVYIETGSSANYLRLLQFYPTSSAADAWVLLSNLQNWNYKGSLIKTYPKRYTTLLDQCRNVKIELGDDKYPPYTKQVNISFDINEDGRYRTCQISAALRCQAGNLIKDSQTIKSVDDD